jgi:hypothetical protein
MVALSTVEMHLPPADRATGGLDDPESFRLFDELHPAHYASISLFPSADFSKAIHELRTTFRALNTQLLYLFHGRIKPYVCYNRVKTG